MPIQVDEAALFEMVRPELEKVAQAIARDARRGYRLKELKTARRVSGVSVYSDSDGVRVVTKNSFAHLDEYGLGKNLLSTPSAAMRRAAMAHGQFHPADKT